MLKQTETENYFLFQNRPGPYLADVFIEEFHDFLCWKSFQILNRFQRLVSGDENFSKVENLKSEKNKREWDLTLRSSPLVIQSLGKDDRMGPEWKKQTSKIFNLQGLHA
jgi:hypothetical protein